MAVILTDLQANLKEFGFVVEPDMAQSEDPADMRVMIHCGNWLLACDDEGMWWRRNDTEGPVPKSLSLLPPDP